jgi:hypothetical protein
MGKDKLIKEEAYSRLKWESFPESSESGSKIGGKVKVTSYPWFTVISVRSPEKYGGPLFV